MVALEVIKISLSVYAKQQKSGARAPLFSG
jgi:hypothetical protein